MDIKPPSSAGKRQQSSHGVDRSISSRPGADPSIENPTAAVPDALDERRPSACHTPVSYKNSSRFVAPKKVAAVVATAEQIPTMTEQV